MKKLLLLGAFALLSACSLAPKETYPYNISEKEWNELSVKDRARIRRDFYFYEKGTMNFVNPDLEIEGVVFTMYDARTNLSLQVVENVKNNLDQNIYKTIIPRNVRLAEAPSYGMPINLYDAKSAGAESYMALADEVIKRKGI